MWKITTDSKTDSRLFDNGRLVYLSSQTNWLKRVWFTPAITTLSFVTHAKEAYIHGTLMMILGKNTPFGILIVLFCSRKRARHLCPGCGNKNTSKMASPRGITVVVPRMNHGQAQWLLQPQPQGQGQIQTVWWNVSFAAIKRDPSFLYLVDIWLFVGGVVPSWIHALLADLVLKMLSLLKPIESLKID